MPYADLKEGFLSDSLRESPQKIGRSASERKLLGELDEVERNDRPEAGGVNALLSTKLSYSGRIGNS